MRELLDDDGRRVKLVWGALTLLVWVAVVWAAWAIWIGATIRSRSGRAI